MSDDVADFVEAIVGTPNGSGSSWIDRVREADAWAEAITISVFEQAALDPPPSPPAMTAQALIAIAAELRAQRIARRPGAGS
jgi:hypothetical protein